MLHAFPPPPRQLGQLMDTCVTTVECLFWSWLLSDPGLGPPGDREREEQAYVMRVEYRARVLRQSLTTRKR
jgi:hypothetical protein